MSNNNSGAQKGGASNRMLILVLTSITSFFVAFYLSALNLALPVIGIEFNADAIQLSWVTTGHLLAVAAFMLSSGKLGDTFGIKKIYVLGTLLSAILTFGSALSQSITFLIAINAVTSIGFALNLANGPAMLTAAFPAEERGKVLGINVATVYAGLSCGPFLGGLLTEYINWRSIFILISIACLVSFILFVWKVKGELIEHQKRKFDLTGSVIYMVSLALALYGFTRLPDIWGGALLVIGIIGMAVFVKWESRAANPLLNILAYARNRAFVFANLTALTSYSAIAAITFLLSLFLEYVKGFSPGEAGLIMMAQPVMQTVLSPLTGRLSDKVEPRNMAALGMTLIFGGLLMFAFLSEDTTILYVVIALLILGVGVACFSSPNVNAAMSSVGRSEYGVASATMSTMRTVGQTLSMGIAMVILGLVVGQAVITPEYYPALLKSTRISFAVFSAICFLSIFASLAIGKIRNRMS